jgi:hypothetical protein
VSAAFWWNVDVYGSVAPPVRVAGPVRAGGGGGPVVVAPQAGTFGWPVTRWLAPLAFAAVLL